MARTWWEYFFGRSDDGTSTPDDTNDQTSSSGGGTGGAGAGDAGAGSSSPSTGSTPVGDLPSGDVETTAPVDTTDAAPTDPTPPTPDPVPTDPTPTDPTPPDVVGGSGAPDGSVTGDAGSVNGDPEPDPRPDPDVGGSSGSTTTVVTNSEAPLFKRHASGNRPVSGLLIEVLQAALKAGGHYSMQVDGSFGGGTEAAIKRYQASVGRPQTGLCAVADWEGITGLPGPSTFDRCLNLTAAFEGHGFGLAVGNFDNAYLTWGITGFTLKHDLPAFIKEIEQRHAGTVRSAFGDKTDEFMRILDAPDSQQEAWGDSISVPALGNSKYGVRADWKACFAKLGTFPEVQRMQLQNARDNWWLRVCLRDCRRWNASDQIDVALFYDTSVQNGGGGRDSIAIPLDRLRDNEPEVTGEDRRKRWAHIISAGSNRLARRDVLSRRMTIAVGEGVVHGSHFELAEWGLSPEPVDLADLENDAITFMPASFAAPAPDPTPDPTPDPDPTPVPDPTPDPDIHLVRDFKQVVAAALQHIDRDDIDESGWGEPTSVPVLRLLEIGNDNMPAGWRDWDRTETRYPVALVQLVASLHGVDVGDIDGFVGPQTRSAYRNLVSIRDTGQPLPADPGDLNPNNWPLSDREGALTAFYGRHGVRGGRTPPLVRVSCPWTLRLAWDKSTTLSSISIHEKCADSLERVLKAVHEHYGDEKIRELRLDLYGGSYNPRKMRGSRNRWSTHAWGIAIDWDPDNNQLRWDKSRATLARSDYDFWWEAWEREGWLSLGRQEDRDWMHVQAALRSNN